MTDIEAISRGSRNNLFRQLAMQSTRSEASLAASQPTPSPYHGKHFDDPIGRFTDMVETHKGTVIALNSLDQLTAAVKKRLEALDLLPHVYCGQDSPLVRLNWHAEQVTVSTEFFQQDGMVALSHAEMAIADTGSLVLMSDNRNPTRNNFLAEHHFVVLNSATIVSYSEQMWEKLRCVHPTLPRAVNFISGPSSSADVGLKLEYGAHGPRSLSVFLITA